MNARGEREGTHASCRVWEIGGGSPWMVGIYLSLSGVLTLVALILGKEAKDVDIDGDGVTDEGDEGAVYAAKEASMV